MTNSREDFMKPGTRGTYHTYARCIRRCFLLGSDEVSGKDYSARKEWIPLNKSDTTKIIS